MLEFIFDRLFSGTNKSSHRRDMPRDDISEEDIMNHMFGTGPTHGPPGFIFFQGPVIGGHRGHADQGSSSAPFISPLFSEMDEMMRGFESMFGQLHDFPTEGNPSLTNAQSPRDEMLKPTEPNVGAGHRASARSPSPGPKQPSVLDRLWASDKWDKATHESVDQDLDSAAKAGELERILGPLKNFNPQQGAAQPYPHERPSANAPSSFSRLSVRSFRMADGKIEERRSVEDESGRREDTISRSMDGQAYTKITETSPLGSTAVKEDFQNMSPQEREEFEARWKGQVGPGALKIPAEQEALLHNKMSESQQEASRNLKGLFKFNFPGFAFGGKDNR